jgi:hypothetical protein
MTRDDIIRMAQEAGWEMDSAWDLYDGFNSRLERFANLVAAAERNKVAQWMIDRSYATGHGDTVEDLLTQLEWQVREREREACAQEADANASIEGVAQRIAAAIRARGEK